MKLALAPLDSHRGVFGTYCINVCILCGYNLNKCFEMVTGKIIFLAYINK